MKINLVNYKHRRTTLSIERKMYRCSIYTEPFLSVRFLCFWLQHDWDKIGTIKEPKSKEQK